MLYLHSYFVDVICIYCGAGIKLVYGILLMISYASNGIPIAMMRKMIARIGVFRVMNARVRHIKLTMASITNSIIGILSIIIYNPGLIAFVLELVLGFVIIIYRPIMKHIIDMIRKNACNVPKLLDFLSV